MQPINEEVQKLLDAVKKKMLSKAAAKRKALNEQSSKGHRRGRNSMDSQMANVKIQSGV